MEQPQAKRQRTDGEIQLLQNGLQACLTEAAGQGFGWDLRQCPWVCRAFAQEPQIGRAVVESDVNDERTRLINAASEGPRPSGCREVPILAPSERVEAALGQATAVSCSAVLRLPERSPGPGSAPAGS